ncbi:hypothetical protein BRADI_3g43185v3 [Brachypodium distachyon]|uniref:Uncharacterized protein n=2 Tax=Brachypodium distachyon TaxID=15368 RepID=A0A2K2D2T9_BRADI|nr:hypothetical protein BRADI_3g43185v3 [Brachypodium distachyon]PNT68589.1 hypothetical protein BRADI_3g43185v3 [Brachypodium distachyon]PNT68590.1 hypothetical protein BRADI_3g43185v3 [Brachypodium distachyon]PNT68593.1 hypothetical protein BRADI_3g43185v3 [Brachypodium distachyon]
MLAAHCPSRARMTPTRVPSAFHESVAGSLQVAATPDADAGRPLPPTSSSPFPLLLCRQSATLLHVPSEVSTGVARMSGNEHGRVLFWNSRY